MNRYVYSNLQCEKVLDWYDGPILWVATDPEGQSLLVVSEGTVAVSAVRRQDFDCVFRIPYYYRPQEKLPNYLREVSERIELRHAYVTIQTYQRLEQPVRGAEWKRISETFRDMSPDEFRSVVDFWSSEVAE